MSISTIKYVIISCDWHDCTNKIKLHIPFSSAIHYGCDIDGVINDHGWIKYKGRHFCREYCKKKAVEWMRTFPNYGKSELRENEYEELFEYVKRLVNFEGEDCSTNCLFRQSQHYDCHCMLFDEMSGYGLRTVSCIKIFKNNLGA